MQRLSRFLIVYRALYDDSCLFVVPKTHNHPRTREQRALSSTLEPPRDPLEMPGAKQVHLKGKYCLISILVSLKPSSGIRYVMQQERPCFITVTFSTVPRTTVACLE